MAIPLSHAPPHKHAPPREHAPQGLPDPFEEEEARSKARWKKALKMTADQAHRAPLQAGAPAEEAGGSGEPGGELLVDLVKEGGGAHGRGEAEAASGGGLPGVVKKHKKEKTLKKAFVPRTSHV